MKNILFPAGIAVILIALGVYVLWPPSETTEGPDQDRVSVVATFYPLGHFAEKVGGDRVDVVIVTPPGAEPHDYEPTPRDIAGVADADLFLSNGNGLDPWADRVATDATTIRMSDHLTSFGTDPHFWLDPEHAKEEVRLIADALIQLDPEHAETYRANQDASLAELDALDRAYQQGLASCETRDIVTSHDAFGYLARRYHLNTVPIAGLSPDAEPSPQAMAEVADIAAAHRVRAIFFETLVSPRIAETIAQEIGVQALPLNPLEGLTDEQIAAGMDYVSVMRDNLRRLRDALSCS